MTGFVETNDEPVHLLGHSYGCLYNPEAALATDRVRGSSSANQGSSSMRPPTRSGH